MLTFTLIDSFSCTLIYAGIRLHNIYLLKWSQCEIGWSWCLEFLLRFGWEICKTTCWTPTNRNLRSLTTWHAKVVKRGAKDETPLRFKQSACRIIEQHLSCVWSWHSRQVWTFPSLTLFYSSHSVFCRPSSELLSATLWLSLRRDCAECAQVCTFVRSITWHLILCSRLLVPKKI